ncbi:hypothetical protein [Pengzhenrongella frigida]|uniref:Uncharacterized protein n=1 Tax=Pengzhenrongella frigida TaxID=1259133 RepID=A0A4Q5N106_9MICO|nr:hypothetical protein [Cellulomonas sp. HLT2-17]RYV51842.1 hypothetical protein EUA98_06285 [Cellulomonas sp. HLT2-17]
MNQHEPAPVWLLLLLAVSTVAATGAVVVTGVILAFSGWMGSEPASHDEWALFGLAVAAMFGVAGAYRWFGRVTTPAVLMALAAVCAMLPLAGLIGAIPLAGAALIASAVPPLRRTRHKGLAFTGVAVAVAVVGALLAAPFIAYAQLNDEIARSDGAHLVGEEPANPPFSAVYPGDDPHQLDFSTRLTSQSFTPAVVGNPAGTVRATTSVTLILVD